MKTASWRKRERYEYDTHDVYFPLADPAMNSQYHCNKTQLSTQLTIKYSEFL